MDWKMLGQEIAKIGLPILGAALPLPGGMALGAMLASQIGIPGGKPEDILAQLTGSTDAMVKAQQFTLTHQETILKIQMDAQAAESAADLATLQAVNETMREEIKNAAMETWLQKSWRPLNGMSVALTSFLSCIGVIALFFVAIVAPTPTVNVGTVVASIPMLAGSITAILAVPGAAVGIAAWHRGVQQRIEAGEQRISKTPAAAA